MRKFRGSRRKYHVSLGLCNKKLLFSSLRREFSIPSSKIAWGAPQTLTAASAQRELDATPAQGRRRRLASSSRFAVGPLPSTPAQLGR